MDKKEFYNIIFGDNAKKILENEKKKEFYDKTHHQHNIELINGKLWYTGTHIFKGYECCNDIKAKQSLEMLKT